MDKPVRLLLVDEYTLFRQGLASLLTRQSDFLVVGEANNGKQATELVLHSQPDVILMDANLSGSNGHSMARVLKQISNVKILLLASLNIDVDLEADALAAGADGYLYRMADARQLCKAIRRMAIKQML